MAARILVIEDNPANLELMRYLLDAFKYEVVTALSGGMGIEIARRERPDLILCDIQLPDMDGFEVVRQIRGDPVLAGTPVVAVTALAMVGDRAMILASGFEGYISKPIDPENFVQQAAAFLAKGARTLRPEPVNQDAMAASAKPEKRRTILAVDNLQANLDLVTELFESFGYRVFTTRDARLVVRLAKQTLPDLILSDVCMPIDNGFELIKSIKSDPQLSQIPFVFITSTMANEQARRTGLALGAAKFLSRPIEPEKLLAEIQACLPGSDG